MIIIFIVFINVSEIRIVNWGEFCSDRMDVIIDVGVLEDVRCVINNVWRLDNYCLLILRGNFDGYVGLYGCRNEIFILFVFLWMIL